jgi:hypothetical protein
LWTQGAAEGSLLSNVRDAYLLAFQVIDARDAFKVDAITTNRYTPDGLRESVKDFSIAQMAKIKKARNTIGKARDRLAELENSATG